MLAVFDLDGTLVSSTVVESYLWLRLSGAPRSRVPREIASLARHAPGWLRAERTDRGRLIREVYTRYAGADPEELARLVDDEVGDQLLSRVSSAGLRRLRAHRAAGHRTVLLTGAVDLLVRPLLPLFDEVVAAQLAVDESGRCTGRLASPPLVGEARAAWLRFTAPRIEANLRTSHAYADSLSDLPMLQCVGQPVAVNPDLPLGRYAAAPPLAGRALGDDRRRAPVGAEPMTDRCIPDGAARAALPARPRPYQRRPAVPLGAALRRCPHAVVRRSPGRCGHCRPRSPARRRRRSAAPARGRAAGTSRGQRMGPGAAAPVGHLRVGPGDGDRPLVVLLRLADLAPVHPGP